MLKLGSLSLPLHARIIARHSVIGGALNVTRPPCGPACRIVADVFSNHRQSRFHISAATKCEARPMIRLARIEVRRGNHANGASRSGEAHTAVGFLYHLPGMGRLAVEIIE